MLQSVLDGRVVRKLGRKASPAERFRQGLLDAVAGAQESFSGYCRLAAQAMLQAAMELEAAEFLGRASYQRRSDGQAAYRNGYKKRTVATGEGAIELHTPQTRDGPAPFQTRVLDAYRRRSETLEAFGLPPWSPSLPQLYVKGLSVRDVSATFAAVFQDAGVSAATASRIGQTLQEDFGTWQQRSLAGYDVLYLFVDGMYVKLHPERDEKQPVLIAYAILWDGRKVLLHVGLGDRESYEACLGFLRDMTERGLRPALLYCSDDCPGLRKALRAVWPKSLPQKCQAHKLGNVLAKLPRGVQAELKRQIHAVFYAQDYETGRKKGRALIEQYQDRYPQAMECLSKSLEECLTCLKLPESHRRRVRTTHSSPQASRRGDLERLIEEARRRTKVQGALGGEQAGLALIYAVTVDVAKRWHGLKVTPTDLEKLNALRAEVAPLKATA